MFNQCGEVDFNTSAGLECLRSNTDALLGKIRRKYKEYGINEKPFVVVKADNGTGGMGILTVRDAREIDNLSAKTKAHMAVTQSRRRSSSGTQPAPSSTDAPRRSGCRSNTPSITIVVRNVSGPWCSVAASLLRTFSPPPIQSFTAARPVFDHAFDSCSGDPPTCSRNGRPPAPPRRRVPIRSFCPSPA
eukprot:gene36775-59950_t